jgi:hypothetical protein
VIVDGKHNEESFLERAVNDRLEDSAGSSINRFYTADNHLFHVDGKPMPLLKCGAGSLCRQ